MEEEPTQAQRFQDRPHQVIANTSDGRSQTHFSTDGSHALHYNVYLSALPKGDGPPAVTFQDVGFSYPGAAGPVLHHVQLDMLDAHEALCQAVPQNFSRFKDVLDYLKQDLHHETPSN